MRDWGREGGVWTRWVAEGNGVGYEGAKQGAGVGVVGERDSSVAGRMEVNGALVMHIEGLFKMGLRLLRGR